MLRLIISLVALFFCFTISHAEDLMLENKLKCRAIEPVGTEQIGINSGRDLLGAVRYTLREMGYDKPIKEDDVLCVMTGEDYFDGSFSIVLKTTQYYDDIKKNLTVDFEETNSKQKFYPLSYPKPFNEIIPDNRRINYAINSKKTGTIKKGILCDKPVTYINFMYQR